MSDRIIIPTADAVITPVLVKLFELRPTSFNHLNTTRGVYWHPVLGFRAQAAKAMQLLARHAADRRLKTAKGQALRDYVASEFNAVPDVGPTFSEGQITLGRGAPSPLPGGDYPKGTRITRSAFVANGVSFASADYETLKDVHIAVDSTANVDVPVRALRAGAHANRPIDISSTEFGLTLPDLVENVVVIDFQAAGGSDGFDDEYVRLFARTFASGEYGPTNDATKLGALSASGARRFLVYDDVPTGSQTVLIADASWASSERWASLTQQRVYDADRVGFGCKIVVQRMRNRVIAVDAVVALRDVNYLHETTEVELAIRSATRTYFDDRPDWNTWNSDALTAAITRAHHKIFNCPSATVKDASTGGVLSEILTPDYSQEQVHFLLANNAMTISFVGPS